MHRPPLSELEPTDHFYKTPEVKPSLIDRAKKIGSSIVDWLSRPAATIVIRSSSAVDAKVDDKILMEYYASHPETHRNDEFDFSDNLIEDTSMENEPNLENRPVESLTPQEIVDALEDKQKFSQK